MTLSTTEIVIEKENSEKRRNEYKKGIKKENLSLGHSARMHYSAVLIQYTVLTAKNSPFNSILFYTIQFNSALLTMLIAASHPVQSAHAQRCQDGMISDKDSSPIDLICEVNETFFNRVHH